MNAAEPRSAFYADPSPDGKPRVFRARALAAAPAC